MHDLDRLFTLLREYKKASRFVRVLILIASMIIGVFGVIFLILGDD